MRVLVAAVLVICLGTIVALGYALPRASLTPGEREQVTAACTTCHDEEDDHGVDYFEGDDFENGDVHQIHSNADCSTCHSGASGMKTADSASKTLKWVGIGLVGVALAGIALNFAVSSIRLKGQDVSDAGQDD